MSNIVFSSTSILINNITINTSNAYRCQILYNTHTQEIKKLLAFHPKHPFESNTFLWKRPSRFTMTVFPLCLPLRVSPNGTLFHWVKKVAKVVENTQTLCPINMLKMKKCNVSISTPCFSFIFFFISRKGLVGDPIPWSREIAMRRGISISMWGVH